ncbi:hypothetical protein H072_11251 [Dactylellina haptotyla CBS 200.50]|uniref:DUF7726 domain-containing protein n=1 Tax=Dactylellina haptotyla (strain CBS 200.50) TaxID=1284197 RepID=S7ZY75_DACHA|nr:hypothetical protein H072_11251 [Dactylellina haptotyla CBS 200.50]
MPAAKRKSTEAGLENQLPPVAQLLKQTPIKPTDGNAAKRLKSAQKTGTPLADISNSPWPIAWTAFGTGKYVEDPFHKVVPLAIPEVYKEALAPPPAAAKKASSRKSTTKKAPAKKATSQQTPVEVPVLVLEQPTVEQPVVEQPAPKPTTKKPAAKKASTATKKATPTTKKATPTTKKTAAKKADAPAPVVAAPAPVVVEAPAEAPAKTPSKATPKKPTTPTVKPTKASSKPSVPDISTIRLKGENTDSVPIFDTCDVVRRKITAALQSGGHTKASIMRTLATCTSEPTKPIPPNSFQRFMAATGRTGGCQNRTFYAGYVYFEKIRIAENKKKTKTREEMETAWGPKGMDYMNIGKPVFMHVTENMRTDQYGREILVRANGKEVILRT